MMGSYRALCGFAFLLLISCNEATETDQAMKGPQVVAGSASENLTPRQLFAAQQAANAGDAHSQALVESHYQRLGNEELYKEWLERGAARNDPAAMQRLSAYLASKGGPENCARAINLLNQAKLVAPRMPTNLYAVIDVNLRVLKGEVRGAPACS